jgi:hypothetical protein
MIVKKCVVKLFVSLMIKWTPATFSQCVCYGKMETEAACCELARLDFEARHPSTSRYFATCATP